MKRSQSRLNSILDQLVVPHRALELGCGDDPDVAIYSADHWQSCLLIGVDLDFVPLRLSAKHYPHLVQADIRQLPFSTPFDLILIRHPNIDKQQRAWQKVMFNLPVTNDGLVVITVYSTAEAEQIRDWFSSLPFTALTLNTSQLHPPYLDGRDRFVLIYRHF